LGVCIAVVEKVFSNSAIAAPYPQYRYYVVFDVLQKIGKRFDVFDMCKDRLCLLVRFGKVRFLLNPELDRIVF
jgi:hypothetical protein